MNNFDDEEELVHHMQEKHADVVQRIKEAQVPWTVLLPFSTGWRKNRIKSDEDQNPLSISLNCLAKLHILYLN